MLYKNMIPNKTYSNTPVLVLPKDITIKKDDKDVHQPFMFIMLADSVEDSIELLNTPALSIPLRNMKVNKCFIPSRMNERIGTTLVNDMLKNSILPKFREGIKSENPSMRVIDSVGLSSIKADSNSNIIYNMAPELEYFMRYRFRKNRLNQVDDFFKFLNMRFDNHFDTRFNDYLRIFYVPLDIWTKKASNGFGVGKDSLDNPLSLFMAAAYYHEDIFDSLPGDFRILLHDRTRNQSMYITKEFLTKKKFSQLKRQLAIFHQFVYKEAPEDERIEIDKPGDGKLTSVDKINDTKDALQDEILNEVKKRMTHAFTGDDPIILPGKFVTDDDIEDITKDEEDSIKAEIKGLLDDNDTDLTSPDIIDDIASDIVSDKIKKTYTPKKVSSKDDKLIKERQERAKKLAEEQSKVIITPDRADMMTIDPLDVSNVVDAINPAVVKSTYANFDKSYIDKKLDNDIDAAVMALNTATNKVFIVNKTVEDTSDISSQKYTYTYELEDERGKKHTIVIDIPKVIDGNRLRINGNNKTVQKQLCLMPIVKTDPDTVVITSWYNKLYIYRQGKNVNTATASIKRYLTTKEGLEAYKGVISNCYAKNKPFNTTLEYDSYSKSLESIKGNRKEIYFNVQLCLDVLAKKGVDTSKIDLVKSLPLGFDNANKTPIIIDLDSNQSVTDYLRDNVISDEDYNKISRKAKGSNKMNSYTTIKIFRKFVPLSVVLLYFEGLTELCNRAKVPNYFFADKEEMDKSGVYDSLSCGMIELADGIFVWKNINMETSLLMSGLLRAPLSGYTREELDMKEYLISLVAFYYGNENDHRVLDQFYEFMIDPNTKMILEDFNLPTHITDVLIYGNNLLADNKSSFIFSAENCRVRSMEMISTYAYHAIMDAYKVHRDSLHKNRTKSISVNRSAVMNALSTDRLVEEASSLNPIMDLEKNRTLTPKGINGVNLDESYSIDKRGYTDDMIGIVAISSSPDGNVGKVKQLTYEPNITSTMGYLQPTPMDDLDDLKNVNLLSTSELLSPPGVLHDDGPRTSMAFKQSKFMVPVPNASPVIVGNKVESAVAYQVSDDFVFKAKKAGKVIDIKEDYVIIEYDDGTKEAIDLGTKMMKNSSNGFWIESQMSCNLKVGDTFEANEILAIDERWFKYNYNDKGASMCIGTLCNIAILVNYDEFEDSIPITQSFANKLQFDVVEEQSFNIGKNAYISKFPKVGDRVRISDALVLYDKSHDDADVNKFLNAYRGLINDEFLQANMSKIKSEFNGEIVKIEIICTCELEELSPTLREIVEEHYKKLGKRVKVLKKHANKGDVPSNICGQVLVELPEKTDTTYGKVKGKYVGDGIRVSVYVKRTNIAKKGDKLASYTALKGIISDVIEEGYEPIALDTDTQVDAFISPLAILARKVPSIINSMFANKCMIEMTRQMREFWKNN